MALDLDDRVVYSPGSHPHIVQPDNVAQLQGLFEEMAPNFKDSYLSAEDLHRHEQLRLASQQLSEKLGRPSPSSPGGHGEQQYHQQQYHDQNQGGLQEAFQPDAYQQDAYQQDAFQNPVYDYEEESTAALTPALDIHSPYQRSTQASTSSDSPKTRSSEELRGPTDTNSTQRRSPPAILAQYGSNPAASSSSSPVPGQVQSKGPSSFSSTRSPRRRDAFDVVFKEVDL